MPRSEEVHDDCQAEVLSTIVVALMIQLVHLGATIEDLTREARGKAAEIARL